MRHQKPVERMQKFLLAAGQDLPEYGPDGHFGLETTIAIEKLNAPAYVKTALKEVGTYEVKGEDHNPRILDYHRTTVGRYGTDEVPWCGAFVNWTLVKHGYLTVDYPERAKSWLAFDIPIDEPVMGAVAIKSRKGGGHVNIVVGKHPNGLLWCVGGNQNDEVNIGLYDPDVFEGFRVPCDYEMSYDLIEFDEAAKTVTSEA